MRTVPDLDTARAARWFHALSDPTRLKIIQRLAAGERCVCELTDALEAAQSRLSFHLRALKDADLVTDRRDGRWIYYSLNRATLLDVQALLGSIDSTLGASELSGSGVDEGCCT
jgi:ArsR family transcriptional regulator